MLVVCKVVFDKALEILFLIVRFEGEPRRYSVFAAGKTIIEK